MNARCTEFWEAFLKAANRPMDTKCYECFYFGNSKEMANELLALVLSGQKRATTSSVSAIEAQGGLLPAIGDLSIVTDYEGNPYCIIETTAVTVLPFKDMSFDICSREGEDETLSSWQEGHIRFFTTEGEQLGYLFSWDMSIIFEDFEVIYYRCEK